MSDNETDSHASDGRDSEYDEAEVQYREMSAAKPTALTHSADDVAPVTADSRVSATELVFKWAPGGPGGAKEDIEMLIRLGIVTK